MAVNPLNAFVGSPPIDGGVLYAADLDVANPTDASTDLPTGYQDHGAVGPDGFTLRPSRSTTTEKRHGGQDWIDLQTESGMEIEFQLLEDDNDAVLETIFGAANVKKTEATAESGTKRTIYHTVEQLPLRKYVLNAQYGGKLKRYGALLARVSNVAEIQNTHSASTKYTVTLRCLVPSDEDLQGAYVVEFRDDDAPLAGVGG